MYRLSNLPAGFTPDSLPAYRLGGRAPKTFPQLPGRDRLLASYQEFGNRRLVVVQTLDDIKLFCAMNGSAGLRWFTGLPLPTSPRDDSSIQEVAVLHRDTVRRGDRVKHWAQRYTGCATATVIGFYNEGTAANPWMMVLVSGDNPENYFSEAGLERGWDYDRTQLAPDVVVV
jgi:hypothetical protein